MVSEDLLKKMGFEPTDRYDYMWCRKCNSICAVNSAFMYIMVIIGVKGVISLAVAPIKRAYSAAYYYTGKCDSDEHFIKLLKDTGLYGYCETDIDV